MYIQIPSLMLAALPIALATTCTTSTSKSWPANNDFSSAGFTGGGAFGGAQDVQGCADFCKQDQDCVTKCLALIMQGQCNAVGGSACDKTRKGKRDTLDCTSDETCYQYTDGSLLCLSLKSGLYHDDVGGNGSIADGTYTSPGGQVQTGTGTPANSATAAATSNRSRATSSPAEKTSSGGSSSTRPVGAAGTATRTAGGSSILATGSSSETSTAPSAAATSNVAEKLEAGVIIGFLGVAAGLIL